MKNKIKHLTKNPNAVLPSMAQSQIELDIQNDEKSSCEVSLPFSEKDLLKGLNAHRAHADELAHLSPVLFMRALKVTHFRQLDDPLTVFGLEGTIFGSVFTLSA